VCKLCVIAYARARSLTVAQKLLTLPPARSHSRLAVWVNKLWPLFKRLLTTGQKTKPSAVVSASVDGYARQFLSDSFRGENKIHTTRRNCAARHRVILGGFILGERNPALFLDCFQAQSPIGRCAGYSRIWILRCFSAHARSYRLSRKASSEQGGGLIKQFRG